MLQEVLAHIIRTETQAIVSANTWGLCPLKRCLCKDNIICFPPVDLEAFLNLRQKGFREIGTYVPWRKETVAPFHQVGGTICDHVNCYIRKCTIYYPWLWLLINIVVISYWRWRDWFHSNLENNCECALVIKNRWYIYGATIDAVTNRAPTWWNHPCTCTCTCTCTFM